MYYVGDIIPLFPTNPQKAYPVPTSSQKPPKSPKVSSGTSSDADLRTQHIFVQKLLFLKALLSMPFLGCLDAFPGVLTGGHYVSSMLCKPFGCVRCFKEDLGSGSL